MNRLYRCWIYFMRFMLISDLIWNLSTLSPDGLDFMADALLLFMIFGFFFFERTEQWKG